jgi:hypothetical protein
MPASGAEAAGPVHFGGTGPVETVLEEVICKETGRTTSEFLMRIVSTSMDRVVARD